MGDGWRCFCFQKNPLNVKTCQGGKGFCFSSYLQGRHNKWLEMMLVIFFDPAVFLVYSTTCNLSCHACKCSSVCMGWQRSVTLVWGWVNYIPCHWTLETRRCMMDRISELWPSHFLLIVCVFICYYVLKMPERLSWTSGVFNSWVLYVILNLLNVCPLNSFIPHKLQ